MEKREWIIDGKKFNTDANMECITWDNEQGKRHTVCCKVVELKDEEE